VEYIYRQDKYGVTQVLCVMDRSDICVRLKKYKFIIHEKLCAIFDIINREASIFSRGCLWSVEGIFCVYKKENSLM